MAAAIAATTAPLSAATGEEGTEGAVPAEAGLEEADVPLFSKSLSRWNARTKIRSSPIERISIIRKEKTTPIPSKVRIPL